MNMITDFLEYIVCICVFCVYSVYCELCNLYIYNSVLACRQHIINSSASAPANATENAVKKVSDVNVCMFGPEL